ncbi:hypothetical protein [Corynebacterium sp.]|uniref:hypothetical protein n=1 Tax=Corynebacterium sp. TaxID=1720 RepID=UPI0026E030DE|nr:hypothetical protein [Corynebacterium sp.]MDO5511582.1 hypothetical protein [Corynebacterium sp.]
MVTPGDLVRARPEDVDKHVSEILSESPASLAAEADQLTRAHAVLQRALQEGH